MEDKPVAGKRRILITGAHGLVGKALVLEALRKGFDIVALVRRSKGPRLDGVEYVTCDLAEPCAGWLAALPPRIDAVVHLAQSPHYREFPEHAGHVFAVNTAATAILLTYAEKAGARTFILTSTGGVYGSPDSPARAAVEEPLQYRSDMGFYAATKLASEAIADAYRDRFTVVNLRGFFIYGPGQQAQMLVPRLVENVRTGRAIAIQGTAGMRFNPLFVEDCGRAIIAALDVSTSMAINLAGPEVTDLVSFCNCIGRFVGRTPVFEFQEGAAPDWTADISRMRHRLLSPQTGVSAGLEAILHPALHAAG